MDFKENKNSNEETSSLVKQAAHDIRSPLSVLNLIAGSENIQMSDEVRDLLKAAVKRINDISADLLESEVKKNFNENKVSLKQIVEGILSEKKALPTFKNIDFKLKCQEGQILDVPDLQGKLERAISNIINNSAEAIVAGLGKIVIILKVKMNRIVLRIVDNGKGIPRRLLSNVGKEGFTAGKSGNDSGFGIGVSQAKAAVAAAGGALKLFSAEGVGTTVLMTIPIL